MMGNYEIPVYLFTGFLGSGKTTFLQDLLDGSDFNDGQSTLVLLFEEGEVELKPDNTLGAPRKPDVVFTDYRAE